MYRESRGFHGFNQQDERHVVGWDGSLSRPSFHSATSKRKTLPARAVDLRLRPAISLFNARVVEWQTRTFEGRMPKGMRVQVPPRAPTQNSFGIRLFRAAIQKRKKIDRLFGIARRFRIRCRGIQSETIVQPVANRPKRETGVPSAQSAAR